jgi:hypothetical protein
VVRQCIGFVLAREVDVVDGDEVVLPVPVVGPTSDPPHQTVRTLDHRLAVLTSDVFTQNRAESREVLVVNGRRVPQQDLFDRVSIQQVMVRVALLAFHAHSSHPLL